MAAHEGTGLGGYARTVVWLREHGRNTEQIADLLGTSSVNVRQLEYRGRRLQTSADLIASPLVFDRGIGSPSGPTLRRFLHIRSEADSVELTPRAERRLGDLEAEVESWATGFWSGVRYESGIQALRAFLPRIGYPAHARRIRLLGRVHELCAETYLHSGSSLRALSEGLRAYQLHRVAHDESGDPNDLLQIGRVARLLSQIFLLRRENDMALHYLDLHRAAHRRLNLRPRPEYYHQRAVLAFREGDPAADPQVRQLLRLSDEGLREVASREAREIHEVRDIGERYLGLLHPMNWESSLQLCREQLDCYSAGDIHVGLNIATTAACGLSIDDRAANSQALDLLDEHAEAASGFRRLETNFLLLRLTPRLPPRIRASWARFALFENAFDHRDRLPRYTNSEG